MKYYKDANGNVYAYAADGSEDAFILPGLIPITLEEANAIRFPPPPLADVKAAKNDEITFAASQVAAQLTAGYPTFEMLTWPDQKAEAMAWNAAGGDIPANATATPYIDSLAEYRGITRVSYLQKTVVKVTLFDKNARYLVGTRQKYVDQVAAIVVNAETTEAQASVLVNAITPVFTLIP